MGERRESRKGEEEKWAGGKMGGEERRGRRIGRGEKTRKLDEL